MHSFRTYLRDATAAAHRRLDARISTLDLAAPDGYRRFLRVHSAALPGLEAGIARHRDALTGLDLDARLRGAALAADLEAMGEPPAAAIPSPVLAGAEEALGAVYVLEGSRLGAKVLLDRVRPDQSGLPAAYLTHGEGERLWPGFLDYAGRRLTGEDQYERAARGALTAFDTFERACRRFVPAPEAGRRAHA